MGDLTKDDLKTTLLFALHIARVDEDFAPTEKHILSKFVDLVGFDEEDRGELAGAGRSLALRLSNLSGEFARTFLIKTLCAMAHADNLMHSSERAFLEKVQALLGGKIDLPPFEEWETLEAEVLEELAAHH